MKKLLYISFLFTLLCNLLPNFVDLSYPVRCYEIDGQTVCSTLADELFFIGIWSFIISILFIVKSDTRFNNFDKGVISFIIGLSSWALVKPFLTDPAKTHFTEYLYLIFGLLFIIIQYAYNNHFKRH